MNKIELKDNVVVGKKSRKEHFRITLIEWRATINAETRSRPMGSDQSDLHEILANKIYEYFEEDKYLKEQI